MKSHTARICYCPARKLDPREEGTDGQNGATFGLAKILRYYRRRARKARDDKRETALAAAFPTSQRAGLRLAALIVILHRQRTESYTTRSSTPTLFIALRALFFSITRFRRNIPVARTIRRGSQHGDGNSSGLRSREDHMCVRG